MAPFPSLKKNLEKSLVLKFAAPVLVAVIIAVIIPGITYFWTLARTDSLATKVRLHEEATIALANMQELSLQLQHAIHQVVNTGNEEQLAAFAELRRQLQGHHEDSYSLQEEAETGRQEDLDAEHGRMKQLYEECNALHTGIGDSVQELIDTGVIVAGTGAKGIDREALLAQVDADFARMLAVDTEIETLLAGDRSNAIQQRQDASRMANYIALVAGSLAVMVGLGIALMSSRRLANPVRQMSMAASRIADGDLSQKIRVSGSDELARLGTTFNTMAKALEQRTHQLEYEKSSMRSIHQSIGDGIVVISNDGTIVSLNPAAEKALGSNAVDLEGKRDIGVSQLQSELERPPIHREEMLKCWEVKKCTHPECPSFESSDRRCWLQCGTHCYNQIQGTFRQKRDACERCDVFQANAVRKFELTIEGDHFSCAIIPILDDEGQQEGSSLVLHDITAIHNAKKELEKHSAELEELQVLTNAVSETLELDATLSAGTRKIYESGAYDAVAIYLRSETEDGLSLASVEGFDRKSPQDLWRLDRRTAPARALAAGEYIIIEDLRRFKRCPDSLRRIGLLSAAIIPLRTEGSEVLGILCAGRKTPGAFDDEDLRLLKLMAAQVSIAARNSMLYDEKVRHARKVLARNRIVSTLTSSLDLDDVFESFATETRKLADYGRMSIALLNERGDDIERIVTHGGCPTEGEEALPFAGSVVEWIAEHKETVTCGDLPNQKRFEWDEALVATGVVSCANIPLIVEEKVIGTLNFCSPERDYFSEEIIADLQPIANQLALALANQDLFEHVTRAKVEWEKTFDAVGEGIVVVNEDHEIVRLNRAAAEMLDSTVAELTGTSCRSRLHQLLTRNRACSLTGAQPGKTSTQMNSELPDGRAIEVVIEPIYDEEGHFSGGVHFLRDITESKQMRQRMMTSEKMVAVGQLVSGVAHEINNPLTGITGYAQLMMMRDDLDEKTRRDVEAIAAESDRATRIVRQLLSFARKHQPERSPVKVNSIVRDCIGLKGYDLKVNNVEIKTELDGELPDIAADQYQLQQVFINLITNAEQAIHENGKAGTLEIATSVRDGKVRVTFTDDGPGVPEEVRSRLFDPFYTTKDVGKGTGLGLSVCFGIIQEHDGSIWAENREDGAGAVFVVELPTSVPRQEKLKEDEALPETGNNTGRILLVDDEESVREVLSETLRRVGHEVENAANGEEALRFINRQEFDCIVSDVKMPVMNGAELHQAVKQTNPQAADRFIFISGDTINEETRRYLEEAPNPSLSKPFSLQDLEVVLNEVLDGRKAA